VIYLTFFKFIFMSPFFHFFFLLLGVISVLLGHSTTKGGREEGTRAKGLEKENPREGEEKGIRIPTSEYS